MPVGKLGLGGLAGRTGAHASLAQAAQTFHQHWRGHKGILAINEVVEKLVVARGVEVEEFLYGALLGSRVTPPIALKIQNSDLEVAQAARY